VQEQTPLLITAQHLRRGAEPGPVPEKGLGGRWRWGLSPKEEVLGSTRGVAGVGRDTMVMRRSPPSLQPCSHL